MRAAGVLGGLCAMALAAFFASAAGAAVTDQWRYIGANTAGERFFYDSDTVIQVSQELRQVWIKELSNEPERRLVEINCPFKIIRDRQVIREGSKKIPSRPVRLPSEWRPMEKDPVEKELHKVLCR